MTCCVTDNGRNITSAFKYKDYQLTALQELDPPRENPEEEEGEVRPDTEGDEVDAVLAGEVLDVGDLLDEYHAEAALEAEETTVRLPPVSVVLFYGFLCINFNFHFIATYK